jgi:hypothetical protein
MEKKKRLSPLKPLDEDLILKLASIFCTHEEIAYICGCCIDTLTRRYMHILNTGKASAKMSLRRKQMEVAMTGNGPMLIWLGKQHLNQKEPKEELTDKQIEEIKVTLHPSLITQ